MHIVKMSLIPIHGGSIILVEDVYTWFLLNIKLTGAGMENILIFKGRIMSPTYEIMNTMGFNLCKWLRNMSLI